MAEQTDSNTEVLFSQLVGMLHGSAMMQMGKIANPVTKKTERNLEQARTSIDMLEMVQKKTEGNLTDNEKKLLAHALFELRMNYVEEANKEAKEKSETQKKVKGK